MSDHAATPVALRIVQTAAGRCVPDLQARQALARPLRPPAPDNASNPEAPRFDGPMDCATAGSPVAARRT